MGSLIGPDFIALQVHDLEASTKFYRDAVGLKVAPAGPPNAVVFDTSPISFAVRTPMVDLDAVPRLGWGIALWFGCDDPDALHATLVDASVSILQEPTDGAFGRQFTFVDPDGYAITAHGMADPQ